MNIPTIDDHLSEDYTNRFSRQICLPEIGIDGQNRLRSSSVLCIGGGGLGSPLLLYLAAAGIGNIGIVDFDLVEESNLHRQVIHGSGSIGKSKTLSIKSRINDLNPHCKVDIYNTILTSQNALDIFESYDLICDCTDNFPSRYLINDACVLLGKPNIYGSIQRFEGQASVFNLTPDSPNYRDLIPKPPSPEIVPSCAIAGVIGVLPGIIGLIQATEAIKIITGIGKVLDGRLLVFNALDMRFKELSLHPSKQRAIIKELINYEEFCGCTAANQKASKEKRLESISMSELKNILREDEKDCVILDVRTKEEADIFSLPQAILIPLDEIKGEENIEKIKKLCQGKKLFVHCESGRRSEKALNYLNKKNIKGVNVIGGPMK